MRCRKMLWDCRIWQGFAQVDRIFNSVAPSSSNLLKKANHPFAIGRRNGLFADATGGTNAGANLRWLIVPAKASKVES